MTNDELLANYFLARLLFWRNDLERIEADALFPLLKVLK